MDGRLPKGIRYVHGRCTDPRKEAEFHRWYNEVHIPDMTSFTFRRPTRYQLLTCNDDGTPIGKTLSRTQFLAAYEIDRDDVDAAIQETRAHIPQLQAQGRMSPLFEMVWGENLRSLSKYGASGGKRTTGVLVVLSTCKDAAKEAEFHRWYDQTHLPDVVGTKLYHTAYRFKVTQHKAGEPVYLAVYETDAADPAAPAEELRTRYRAQWEKAGRYSPLFQLVWRGVFRRIYPA